MKVAVVLGSVSVMTARHLAALEIDCIYYFSGQESLLLPISVAYLRLDNPQRDIRKESAIVERCIERNIGHISGSSHDAALMRRALRLSELRVEARCYLNIIDYVKTNFGSRGQAIESVTIVSHYLMAADTLCNSSIPINWLHVPHMRFFGLIPGLGRLFFLYQYIFSRKPGSSIK